MIDISKLSKRYSVRVLEESDVETLVEIMYGSPSFLLGIVVAGYK